MLAPMTREIMAATLRAKAVLCRRAATHSTNGGHLEDKLLLQIAEHLEKQAAALEQNK